MGRQWGGGTGARAGGRPLRVPYQACGAPGRAMEFKVSGIEVQVCAKSLPDGKNF